MRPMYEKEEDRAKEHAVFSALAKKLNCVCITTPKLSRIDRLICTKKGTLSAIVELKTRTNAHDKYPTYMLSAAKYKEMLALANALKVPALLLVEYTDKVRVVTLKDTYEFGIGGRTDRDDALDIEQCIYIPITDFRDLNIEVNYG
jgi:hypothetical protein